MALRFIIGIATGARAGCSPNSSPAWVSSTFARRCSTIADGSSPMSKPMSARRCLGRRRRGARLRPIPGDGGVWSARRRVRGEGRASRPVERGAAIVVGNAVDARSRIGGRLGDIASRSTTPASNISRCSASIEHEIDRKGGLACAMTARIVARTADRKATGGPTSNCRRAALSRPFSRPFSRAYSQRFIFRTRETWPIVNPLLRT